MKSLRDVSIGMLEEHRNELKGKMYQRCRYVVEEIARVQLATEDLKHGDLAAFGRKMYDTHDGLSNLYEVSCEELDFLVAEARKLTTVIGARMMGGGFGGCTINLVKRTDSEKFIAHMRSRYKAQFNIDMPAYDVKVVDGTGRVKETELSLWT